MLCKIFASVQINTAENSQLPHEIVQKITHRLIDAHLGYQKARKDIRSWLTVNRYHQNLLNDLFYSDSGNAQKFAKKYLKTYTARYADYGLTLLAISATLKTRVGKEKLSEELEQIKLRILDDKDPLFSASRYKNIAFRYEDGSLVQDDAKRSKLCICLDRLYDSCQNYTTQYIVQDIRDLACLFDLKYLHDISTINYDDFSVKVISSVDPEKNIQAHYLFMYLGDEMPLLNYGITVKELQGCLRLFGHKRAYAWPEPE